ncbi:MAG: DUF6056 family protein [Candidatus Microsaccharimonas sp.]
MSTGYFRKSLPLVVIFAIGILLFAFLIALNQRIPGSDDTVFQAQILPYHSVFEWVSYRYQTWSGRIFSEAGVYIFSSAPLILWKLVSVTMYALFVCTLFGFYKLSQQKTTLKQDSFLLIIFLALPFLIDKSVLAEGGVWVTGSIVYFWMVTLGMIAFYPVAYYLTKLRRPHWVVSSLGLVAGIIAASSQEQVGAVLIVLTLAFTVWLYVTKKIIPRYLIIYGIVIAGSMAVSILAPGNSARLDAELITWLPDLTSTPIPERIIYGYRWLLNAFINHSGFLLAGIWAVLAILFQTKLKKDTFDTIFAIVLAVASIVLVAKGFDATSYLFNFYSVWNEKPPSTLSSLNLIPWGILLIVTVVAPIILFRKKAFGYLLSILIIASFSSALILLLSPTMYASLWRAFFVPSVLLLIVLSLLLGKLLNEHRKFTPIIVAVVLGLGLIHYLYQIVRLLHAFH